MKTVLALGVGVAVAVLRTAQANAEEPPGEPAPVTARVHLQSESRARLVIETHVPGSPGWSSCCASPCDLDLPVDRDYRVSADGVVPSACVRLTARPGDNVVLDAHPVSQKVHTTSLVLLGVGLVLFTAGDAISDVFLGLEAAQVADKEPPPKLASELIVPGLVIAAVGAVAFGTGGALFLATRNPTTVTQSTTPCPTPVWQAAHDTASAPASPVTVRLLSGTF